MKRREFAKLTALSSALGFTSFRAFANSYLQEAKFEMKLLRDDVGVFTSRGGTIVWRIARDGIAVVDSQFQESAEVLIGEIGKKQKGKIDLLLNTHHHGDHSNGNIAFEGIAKKVVAHQNSKINQERVATDGNRLDDVLLPDTTFETDWNGKVGKEIITATYFGRAHTNGDSVIHLENANVAHLGDLLFHQVHPYVDTSAGANIHNWITVLENIRKKYDSDTLFVFGHSAKGEITGGKDKIVAKEAYLNGLLDFVKKEMTAGKSKEEIQATSALPGFDFGDRRLSANLGTAYAELSE